MFVLIQNYVYWYSRVCKITFKIVRFWNIVRFNTVYVQYKEQVKLIIMKFNNHFDIVNNHCSADVLKRSQVQG